MYLYFPTGRLSMAYVFFSSGSWHQSAFFFLNSLYFSGEKNDSQAYMQGRNQAGAVVLVVWPASLFMPILFLLSYLAVLRFFFFIAETEQNVQKTLILPAAVLMSWLFHERPRVRGV